MRIPHHFSLPTRVSRLYPIFSIILLLNSSILLYAWQRAEIKLDSYQTFEEREQNLKSHVDTLLTEQKNDRAQLELQNQKVKEATERLVALEKDLSSKQAQLDQANSQLTKQQSQLSQNATELEKLRARPPLFSFQNESSVPGIDAKKDEIKILVTNAYDYIRQLYGEPYLLNSIVITFVNNLSIEGSAGEIVIQNSSSGITINIRLKDFDKNSFQDINTVIHEIVHGFHGVAVFESSALEEGMTIAATEAIMKAMIRDGKLPQFEHLYLVINDQQYAAWNSTLKVHNNNDDFYNSNSVAQIYQLIGKAWYQLYEEDPHIFKDINAAYYPKIQKGLDPDNAMVLDAIRASLPSVKGTPINTYLALQSAFNPN